MSGFTRFRLSDVAGVQIWTAPTEGWSEAIVSGLLDTLDPSETARSARFRVEAARFHYVAAHALARFAIGRALARNARSLEFDYDSLGKPHLVGATDLGFSLSHADGLVGCALGVHREIGIDIENMRQETDLDAISDVAFAGSEREWVAASSIGDRRELIFQFWTLKEAYLKAKGVGFSHPPEEAVFDLAEQQPRLKSNDGFDADWRFGSMRAGAAHIVSVAVRTSSAAPVAGTWLSVSPGSAQALFDIVAETRFSI
jgi:4'-phosphopantetheinyl transferase